MSGWRRRISRASCRPLTPPGIMMSDSTTSIAARVGQRAERRLRARDVRDRESKRAQQLTRERRDLPVVLHEQHVSAALGLGRSTAR